jgi:hypothetical protein
MDGSLANRPIEETEQMLAKTAFLSYYISMYNVVNESIGYEKVPVTIEEIYDFVQDIRVERERKIPKIGKEDIRLCFHMLRRLGICKVDF